MQMQQVLAICGLVYLLKESYVCANLRILLMNRGTNSTKLFFFNLFSCYFCLGCHCGWIVYLLSNHSNLSIYDFALSIPAGGTISLIFGLLLDFFEKPLTTKKE